MQNAQLLLNPLLHLAIIVPLLLIFMKERTRENYLRVVSIVVCYCLYSIALVLPYLFDSLHFINGSWNWNGKLFGLACGVILYFLFRRQFADNNFFTLKQNKEGLRSALKVAIGLLSVYVLAGLLGEKEFDTETLLFQISMPGLDEEVMCRGVMLGLMCSTLREGGKPSLNPAIIINGIWFGTLAIIPKWRGGVQCSFVYRNRSSRLCVGLYRSTQPQYLDSDADPQPLQLLQ